MGGTVRIKLWRLGSYEGFGIKVNQASPFAVVSEELAHKLCDEKRYFTRDPEPATTPAPVVPEEEPEKPAEGEPETGEPGSQAPAEDEKPEPSAKTTGQDTAKQAEKKPAPQRNKNGGKGK